MSESNIETVRKITSILDHFDFAALRDAMERSDADAITSGFAELDELVLSSLTPDVVVEFHGDTALPEGRRYTGIEGLLKLWRQWLAAFDDYRVESGDYEQVGDSVVYRVVHYTRGRGSGLEFEAEQGQRWMIRDGKVAEIHVYDSRDEARADT